SKEDKKNFLSPFSPLPHILRPNPKYFFERKFLLSRENPKQSAEMASTAKTATKKAVSYSEMAKKTTEKAYFGQTECALKTPPNLPSKQTPNTNEEFSFFVNLDMTDASQEEIANVMPNGVVGVVPRLDLG